MFCLGYKREKRSLLSR